MTFQALKVMNNKIDYEAYSFVFLGGFAFYV